MAALTSSISVIPQRRLHVVTADDVTPVTSARRPGRSVAASPKVVSITERRRRRAILARRRRLAALVLSSAILVGTWGITTVLATLRPSELVRLPGSVQVTGGYLYTVHSGDTVWSIATRLDPSGNPWPIATLIDSHLDGSTIVPGQRILVP